MDAQLRRITGAERVDHTRLRAEHRCYYWQEYTPWEYTKGLKSEYSDTNRLIEALKTSVERRGEGDLESKRLAIQKVGGAFAKFWRWSDLLRDGVMLVPMPPSRVRDDLLYDDRMVRVLSQIQAEAGMQLPIRDILRFDGSTAPSHTSVNRPTLKAMMKAMSIDYGNATEVAPKLILLFDDVLTTGAHFVVAYTKLMERFPTSLVIGNFVARCVRSQEN